MLTAIAFGNISSPRNLIPVPYLSHDAPVMMKLLKQYAPGPLSGFLLALAFPAFDGHPLAWLALIPLFWRAAQAPLRQSAMHFFAAGWVFHSLVLQWLMANIFWGGGWAVIGYQLLCVGLALFWAIFGALWAWTKARNPRIAGAAALAILWGTMEWLQATLFTGFGWTAIGYSQGPNLVMAQWAAIGGVSFVSIIVVGVNALLALGLAEKRGRWARLAAAILILGSAHGIGAALLGPADYDTAPYQAGLYQSNYPQEMKWDSAYLVDMVSRAAEQSSKLAMSERVDLLVWPEALVMRHYERPPLLEIMQSLSTETQAYLFAGTVRNEAETGRSFNSSVMIRPDGGAVAYYDKVHLAPFGEYMPFDRIFPFLRQIVPLDVDAGDRQKVLDAGGRRIGPLICFEVLFAPMAEELRRMGADMIVVITNLAWFGGSNAIPQEFELARLRAIETRLPVVHCANTGISGVFDPWGRFTPLSGAVDYYGRYFNWTETDPRAGIMRRLVGAVPVPAPASRPLPFGPPAFPRVVLPASAVLLALALWRPRRTADTVPAVAPPPKGKASRKRDRA